MVRLIGSFPFESVSPCLCWLLFGQRRSKLLPTFKTDGLGVLKVDRSELHKCDNAEAEPSVQSSISWCWYLIAPERFRRLQICRLAL